jgi:hypothetical protein
LGAGKLTAETRCPQGKEKDHELAARDLVPDEMRIAVVLAAWAGAT